MARINRIIPFGFWPANWGMTGKRKARAEAEYYWDGIDLARKLVEIDHESGTPGFRYAMALVDKQFNLISTEEYELCILENTQNLDESTRLLQIAKHKHKYGKITTEEFELENLRITHPVEDSEEALKAFLRHDLKYRKINEKEYDQRLLEFEIQDHESIEFKLRMLDLEKKHGSISNTEWEKQTATLVGEPWFNIIGGDLRRSGDGSQLAIELDWNEHFPRFLESKGWAGHTDDEIVDRWFEEAMRQMVDPGLDDDQMGALEDEDYLPARGTRRQRGEDGRTEYS